jgi:hypothetical protein
MDGISVIDHAGASAPGRPAPVEPPPSTARGRADIWPLRSQHVLHLLDLTEVRSAQPAAVTGLADELAALADASWALDRESLAAISSRREINLAAAASLALLARNMGGELGGSLMARADAVARGDWGRNAHLTVACEDHRIVVVYGPLRTWSTKDDGCRFSATVSVENKRACALIDSVDQELPAAASLLANECGAGDLRFWHLPDFVVTDLLACGGEANTFPKHFAFFLPEDAGVPEDGHLTKTIVFGNVYHAQFEGIARPVAERVLAPWRPLAREDALRTLLVWFRGHDVGHFLGPHAGQVDYQRVDVGRARTGLQEVFADVIGYLLASSPGVLRQSGVDGDDLAAVFLAEMLRYFRRGWEWFPDSCAALVELVHLVEGGWLRIDEDGLRLHWDAAGLREGLLALATDLSAALLRGEQAPLERLVARCNDDPPAWLKAWEARLLEETKAVGDALVYGFRG